MNSLTFYHAGCPVCVSAEQQVLDLMDKNRYSVDIVHLGENQDRFNEAQDLGVKSVPALVVNDQVFHINFGASIEELSA